MRHTDLHLHATAATMATVAHVTDLASPMLVVAMFYVGVLVRRYG